MEKVTLIGSFAFRCCSKLESVYLNVSSVPTLSLYVFSNTPLSSSAMLGRFGSIYVPSSLYNSFSTKANWSTYKARLVKYDFVNNQIIE